MNVLEFRGFVSSQLDGPRRHLALCSELRDAVLQRPRTAADTSALLGHELDRARLANALGAYDELQEALAAAASLAAAMTVRELVKGGEVELGAPGQRTLLFPQGDAGASPPLWLDGLACAVVARDAMASRYLANSMALEAVSRAAAVSGRPIGTEPFWVDYGRAFIALIHGQPIGVAHAQNARQQMATGPIGVLVREGLAVTDQPVLTLIEIVAAGAVAEWPGAVRTALEQFHHHFTRQGYSHSLPGYLPLGLLAVCRLAADRGFPVPQASPYLPERLVRGDTALHETSLAVRYPLQGILGADEAHWFFDLQGYARAGRTHRLLDRDGTLVAHYDVPDSADLPGASADFVLVDRHRPTSSVPLALDGGQLVFLAQAFASQCRVGATADASRARILLSDAVACIDAALARIPDDEDAVPPASIRSNEGRTLIATEPGRFRRSRLTAYRTSLWSQLRNPDMDGAAAHVSPKIPSVAQVSTGNSESDVRQNVEILSEVIRARALPVLQSFAHDSEGTFVRSLQPRDEDYDIVFVGEAAHRARNAYRSLWSGELHPPRPLPTQTEIQCAVAPAGMLTWRNELSNQFPSGYEHIATLLNPHRVWLAWKYVQSGKPSGLAFDGLVWVEDHWAWFPKPYRYLTTPEGADLPSTTTSSD